MQIDKANRQIIITAAKAAGAPMERILRALAVLGDKPPPDPAVQPFAVRQAGVCALVDCSRFHVRKLVKEGKLKQHDISGLKRYAVSEVLALIGG